MSFFLDIAQAAAVKTQEAGGGFSQQVGDYVGFVLMRIPAWIASFVVFVGTIFVAKIAKSAIEAKISSQVDEEHQEVVVLAGRVTYFMTLAFGIIIALKIAGIDLTTILAAVAFGIGFALRDFIMNFLSGVMILVNRQFTIGDFIKVGDTIGRVMEIQTRATVLKTFEGTKVIVPNSELFTKHVTSYTSNPLRRIAVPVFISYDADIQYATKILVETLKKHPKILKKPLPSVIVKEYGDYTINLTARFWVGSRDGWYRIRSEALHQMWTALSTAGIDVPYKTVHFETTQDTAAYLEQMAAIEKKKKEEMGLSNAIASANGATATAALPATNGAVPQTLATVTVPVPTGGEVADLEEIDMEG